MFTQKRKQYYSKILGFKSVEDFESFAKRYSKYLEKNKQLSKQTVMNGFFILVEIQKESLKNKNLINFDGIKNPYLKKYADEILEQRKLKNGSFAIAKYLMVNHNVKVSRGSIEKLYKNNGL